MSSSISGLSFFCISLCWEGRDGLCFSNVSFLFNNGGLWHLEIFLLLRGVVGRTTKMVTKRPNMDRTRPRIYDNEAVHLNIHFQTTDIWEYQNYSIYIYIYPPPCPCGTKWSDRGSTAAVLVGWMDWFKGARPPMLRTSAYSCVHLHDFFRPIFRSFFWYRFLIDFSWIWEPSWPPKPLQNPSKIQWNLISKFTCFLIYFLLIFGRVWGPKITPKIDQKSIKIHVHRNVKNHCFSWEGHQKLKVRAFKNQQKINLKLMQISISFLIDFLMDFWCMLAPCWAPRST